MLADRALVSENDVDESRTIRRPVSKVEKVRDSNSCREEKESGRAQTSENRAPKAQCAPTVQAKSFTPTNQKVNRRGLFTNTQQSNRPYVLPPTLQPNTVQPTDTVSAQVYYHQNFGDTGAAVRVSPKSCANRFTDAASLPLVAANNTTINTYGTSKRVPPTSTLNVTIRRHL